MRSPAVNDNEADPIHGPDCPPAVKYVGKACWKIFILRINLRLNSERISDMVYEYAVAAFARADEKSAQARGFLSGPPKKG